MKKVAQDILKLSLVRSQPGRESTRLVIVFASGQALNSVLGSWLRLAAQVHHIELVQVEIDPELRDQILEAQVTQNMVSPEAVADDINPIPIVLDDFTEDWPKRTFDFWRTDTEQMDTIAEISDTLCQSHLDSAIMIANYPFPEAIPPRLMSEAQSLLRR